MNVTASSKPLMSERKVSLLGALFVAIGPISMALYTPSMPEIVSAFGTTEAMVKLTLTLYFGGFACAQLVAGPLSDALGRRPVIFAFLGIYIIGAVFCFLATGIEMLIASRFLQGIGASAGIAISRAIVRDLYVGHSSSRIMNRIGIILALGPAVSPTVGGFILILSGWRALFLFMIAIGFSSILVAAIALKETVQADRARLNFANLARSYVELLKNRHFLTTATVIGGSLGAIYAQATFLPFVLMDDVGLSPPQFGVAMLFQSGSFFVGSLLVLYLMRRISAYRLVMPGMVFVLTGSAFLLLLLFREPSLMAVMIPVAIFVFGLAFIMPAMSTAALAPFPRSAGAASAMLGFLQMGSGLVGGSLGALLGNATLAISLVVPAMGIVAFCAYRIYLRHPHLAEPEPRSDVITGPPFGRSLMRD